MKTITVRGTGTASKRPDKITLTLSVEGKSGDYETALAESSERVEKLTAALIASGAGRPKTTDYDVRTEYKSVRDEEGNYTRVFDGYVSAYSLTVSFGLDMELLAAAIGAVSASGAEPGIGVSFGLYDPASLDAELLRAAAVNAKEKAEVLCGAMGKKLGELISIDYDFKNQNRISRTNIECATLGAAPKRAMACVEPDDIEASDSASFVWEIV